MSLKLRLMIVATTIIVSGSNGGRSKRESSAEYLKKAMVELQELNEPTAQRSPATVSSQPQKKKFMVQSYVGYAAADRSSNLDRTSPSYYNNYDEKATAVGQTAGSLLALNRAELAALYKSALERGSPISLSALTNGLSNGKVPPRITATSLDLPLGEETNQQRPPPMYQYYFFPLKTFASELQKEHGYKTVPSSLDNTSTTSGAAESQELSNPLFLAISSFIGMALLFIMGVLFLPKFGHFAGFNGRAAQDDFLLHLTNHILGALDNRDFVNGAAR